MKKIVIAAIIALAASLALAHPGHNKHCHPQHAAAKCH